MPWRIVSPVTRERIGRRGAFLLILSVMDALTGWSLLDVPPAVYRQLTLLRHVPQFGLALSWLLPAAVALFFAFARRTQHDAWGFLACYVPPAAFGVIYFTAWFPFGQLPAGTGVRSAVVYWGYSLLILVAAGWPEPSGAVPRAPSRSRPRTPLPGLGTEKPGKGEVE